MNYDILCGNIRLFQVCRILPSPLKNGMVPLDIDVTQFDNSKTHKEGVEGIAMGALSHHERYDGKVMKNKPCKCIIPKK